MSHDRHPFSKQVAASSQAPPPRLTGTPPPPLPTTSPTPSTAATTRPSGTSVTAAHLSEPTQLRASDDPRVHRYASAFADLMEMRAPASVVAAYLDCHEGWFRRCAAPMAVAPLGINGYVLTLGRFGNFGFEVEPTIGLELLPQDEGIYRIITEQVPDADPALPRKGTLKTTPGAAFTTQNIHKTLPARSGRQCSAASRNDERTVERGVDTPWKLVHRTDISLVYVSVL